ncbi:MAG: hydroxymethylglutaryl-CoA lyase [Rhizobium sp.]|nr:hydroxymethylglutaryl-CoA lyase [Rhizobium sp.]
MSRVRIVEVGPRDGLQNEAVPLPPQVRIEFIRKLLAAGLDTIEVGSFVSPKWVPQMAGTDEVLSAVIGKESGNFPVLVPNEKGLDAAIAAGAREIAVFASASESFSQKNINCSIAESIERFRPVAERAKGLDIRLRGYVSCVLGCPYEGAVPVSAVADVAEKLVGLGCYEISLGDTIGVGTPGKARDLVRSISSTIPAGQLAVHFHDTYGQALANIYAALLEGVAVIDSAAGGLGGCPYAKGASGNVATENVVYMLEGLGVPTGVDMPRLLDAVTFISGALGRTPQSNVYKALAG